MVLNNHLCRKDNGCLPTHIKENTMCQDLYIFQQTRRPSSSTPRLPQRWSSVKRLTKRSCESDIPVNLPFLGIDLRVQPPKIYLEADDLTFHIGRAANFILMVSHQSSQVFLSTFSKIHGFPQTTRHRHSKYVVRFVYSALALPPRRISFLSHCQ